jgi:hypothetical protein
MRQAGYLYFFLMLIVYAGCTNPENKPEGTIPSSPLYYSLNIWGEEGNDSINCLFQYHSRRIDGPVIFPGQKAIVQLDNEVLKADSAKLSGPYYDLRIPKDGFNGNHLLQFTGTGNKLINVQFTFNAFHPSPGWPVSIKRGPYQLKFKNFPLNPSVVRLSLVDTSFATNDFNELVDVENGRLQLTASMFKDLTPGPISMEITREEEKPDKNGKIWISYSIRREFELVE